MGGPSPTYKNLTYVTDAAAASLVVEELSPCLLLNDANRVRPRMPLA